MGRGVSIALGWSCTGSSVMAMQYRVHSATNRQQETLKKVVLNLLT
jgi:hypothetical protein